MRARYPQGATSYPGASGTLGTRAKEYGKASQKAQGNHTKNYLPMIPGASQGFRVTKEVPGYEEA